jgi:uncharacterized membrane protein
MKKRTGVILILILAFFGLADSVYLAQHAATGEPLICSIGGFDCNTVAESKYSRVFGIPVADFGVLFYSTLFILAALELVLFDRVLRRVLQGFAIVGILFSLYSVAVQVFLIQALCIYCIASAVLSVGILALASFLEPIGGKSRTSIPPSSPTLSMPPQT